MQKRSAAWEWSERINDSDLGLILVGDTNIQYRENPGEAFSLVLPTLRGADVLFGQLEGPLSPPSQDPAAPDIPHKEGWTHSEPRMVEAIAAAGFDAVGCAGNVTYGAGVVESSLATLDASGIGHCGAGVNLAEAHRPAIVETKGVRIGFLSYTSVFWPVGHAATPHSPGVATIKAHTAYQPGPRALEMPGAPPTVITYPDSEELERMRADIRALRKQVEVVIVSCHWGISGSETTVDYQRAIAHEAVDQGADLVFGHHPHVIQGIEVWKGKPIFYSLGNFTFDWDRMRGNVDGLLVRCAISGGRMGKVCFVPVRRNQDGLVEILNPAEGAGKEIVDRAQTLSTGMPTLFHPTPDDVLIVSSI